MEEKTMNRTGVAIIAIIVSTAGLVLAQGCSPQNWGRAPNSANLTAETNAVKSVSRCARSELGLAEASGK
jgi:hypothetical protein